MRAVKPLAVFTAFSFIASNAAAGDNRTVKLSVSVIEKDQDVAWATVTVIPEGGPPVTGKTDDKGTAVLEVPIAAPRFGEGWLRSAPTLSVVATKDSVSGQKSVTVRSKDFQGGNSAALSCTIELKSPALPVTVQLTVRVIDDQDNLVSGAIVSVRQLRNGGPLGPNRQASTDAGGLAHVTIDVTSGETLDLAIEVRHEGMETQTLTFNFGAKYSPQLPAKEFKLKKGEDKDVYLSVRVRDEQGKAVSGAKVNVHQSNLGYVRTGIVMPPDYSENTNADGLARLTIKATKGQKLDLAIEVAREDMETGKQDLNLGDQSPERPPPVEFKLKKKSDAAGAGQIINVAIEVLSEGQGVEGANVMIRDTSLGSASGRFPGVTGADGRATIPVLYASADQEETLPVEVSKSGYKTGKTFIKLNRNQVGKTIVGDKVTLEKVAKDAAKVTITVTDATNGHGVGDATVILDGAGYYSQPTNSNGEVTFLVGEIGGFQVRISQDTYKDFTDGFRLSKGPKDLPLSYKLVPKATKDEGHDRIEVTVLKKDPTDENSKPSPLPGAYVKAGTIATTSDPNGKAILEGAFADKQEVSVEASGYKSQHKTVGLSKANPFSNGKGSTTFTLDPELSENSAIRLIVEVHGANNAKVQDANVEFYSASGALLGKKSTDKAGSVDFRSSEAPNVPIADLRKGMSVNVKATGYKEILNRSIPGSMLDPRLEAAHFSVELERDWSELEKELAALEARVAAWTAVQRTGPSKEEESALIDKALLTLKRAKELHREIWRARQTSHLGGDLTAAEWCRKATRFKEDIQLCDKEANQKTQELKQLLDAAATLTSTCSVPADAETIRNNYRAAIKLVGEIGVRNKKAVKDRDELLAMAKESLKMKKLLPDLQNKVTAIDEQWRIAEEASKSAAEQYGRFASLNKTLATRQVQLKAEFAVLTVKYAKERDQMPSELNRRFDAIERALDTNNSVDPVGKPKNVPQSISSAPAEIEALGLEAENWFSDFRDAACDIDTMEDTVNGLDTTLSNASFEIGLAADLPAKADACAAKATDSPSPTPESDEITVPDVSGFDQPGAMKAAAGPDMVGVIMATKQTPPAGTTKLFAYQEPPANSKAKRGSPLKIFIYQSLASVSSPTPSPSLPSSSPSVPASDEVTVPDVSGSNDPKAMKAAAGPDMVGVVLATKSKPPPGSTQLFASQDPPANTKAKRGSTLKIYVYQSLADAAASPAATGGMPNLIGLTLDQAVTRLKPNVRINSDEIGDKPPTPELALTIFYQDPAAGAKVDANKPFVVTVKRYGSAKATVQKFDGTYVGSYSGKAKGRVSFTVTEGAISISSPGSGSGSVSATGSANFSGAGTDTETTYTFTGTFAVGPDGKATAHGSWSGTQSGYGGSGTWNAARP